jgi:hypothetical protein
MSMNTFMMALSKFVVGHTAPSHESKFPNAVSEFSRPGAALQSSCDVETWLEVWLGTRLETWLETWQEYVPVVGS